MVTNKTYLIGLLFLLVFSLTMQAQEKNSGPILKDYGKVWSVQNPDFNTQKNTVYKVVFDIMNSPDSPKELNRSIETAARFLNMHAQAGVPPENLKVAMVVHNKASKDLLDSKFYETKYSVANPNQQLIEGLLKANVSIIFCGQSSLSREIPIAETIEGTQLALSAMTALVLLQNEGYRLIKF